MMALTKPERDRVQAWLVALFVQALKTLEQTPSRSRLRRWTWHR